MPDSMGIQYRELSSKQNARARTPPRTEVTEVMISSPSNAISAGRRDFDHLMRRHYKRFRDRIGGQFTPPPQ